MIKIAICDDESAICGQLETILINLLNDRAIEYDIDVYCNSEELCQQLNIKDYDLLFLDIELPDQNGIATGRYIRETLGNEQLQIAYISSKTSYAMELFEFRPINFLEKPLTTEMVTKVIDKFLLVSNYSEQLFTYKKSRDYFKIPFTDIIYFESKGRKVTIHMTNGQDTYYDSLENIYPKVKGSHFLFIHKSIIVNYLYIKQLSYEEVTMTDGSMHPISQSRRKDIKTMYMKIRKEVI